MAPTQAGASLGGVAPWRRASEESKVEQQTIKSAEKVVEKEESARPPRGAWARPLKISKEEEKVALEQTSSKEAVVEAKETSKVPVWRRGEAKAPLGDSSGQEPSASDVVKLPPWRRPKETPSATVVSSADVAESNGVTVEESATAVRSVLPPWRKNAPKETLVQKDQQVDENADTPDKDVPPPPPVESKIEVDKPGKRKPPSVSTRSCTSDSAADSDSLEEEEPAEQTVGGQDKSEGKSDEDADEDDQKRVKDQDEEEEEEENNVEKEYEDKDQEEREEEEQDDEEEEEEEQEAEGKAEEKDSNENCSQDSGSKDTSVDSDSCAEESDKTDVKVHEEREILEKVDAVKVELSSVTFDLKQLLKWKQSTPSDFRDEDVTYIAVESKVSAPEEPTPKSQPPTPASGSWRDREAQRGKTGKQTPKSESTTQRGDSKKLESSENSWAAMQRLRRSSSAADDEAPSDEEVVRRIKGVLNKITVEKFDELYRQLITCGMTKSLHVELLVRETFEKATTQHHFIDMYADLCAQLNDFFVSNPIGDDAKNFFKKILLNECQGSFERHLTPPSDLGKLHGDDRMLAEVQYKTRMLGNIRFVGALLARKMLASKVLLAVVEELLNDPTSEALESLAALLTSVGGTFDFPDWAYHKALCAAFEQVRVLSTKSSVEQRVRCLLKDVLDLRKAAWNDKKPKKIEGPKTIDQVHEQAYCEEAGKTPKDAKGWEQVGGSSRKSQSRNLAVPFIPMGNSPAPSTPIKKVPKAVAPKAAEPAMSEEKVEKKVTKSGALEKLERAEREKKASKDAEKAEKAAEKAERKAVRAAEKEAKVWDRDSFREEVKKTLAELRVSHASADAALRLADTSVPAVEQAHELCHILSLIAEEGSAEGRKAGFAMLAKLFLDKSWSAESLNAGLQAFVEEVCEDLRCDVPALPRILKEELHPEFAPLVAEGLLDAKKNDALIGDD